MDLTRAAENDLVLRSQAGDSEATAVLVEKFTEFVAWVVHPYRDRGVPAEDMMQGGMLNFLQCLSTFDVTRGFRLCTYAYWPVKRGVIETLVDGRVIRPPSKGYSIEDVRKFIVSTDRQVVGRGVSCKIGDLLVSNEDGPADLAEQHDTESNVMDVLDLLSERNREIVKMRFGIRGRKTMTLREIGLQMGISHERVRQILVRSMEILKEELQ